MNTITHTACYTAFLPHDRRDDLLTEVKVQSGENANNLEYRLIEGKEAINFTITLSNSDADDVSVEEELDTIGRDIARFLDCEVDLDDILIDD